MGPYNCELSVIFALGRYNKWGVKIKGALFFSVYGIINYL